MKIKEAIVKYINKEDFFGPDYERDNEILVGFKINNQILSPDQTQELINILNEDSEDWYKKYFVADLLYYYDTFDLELMGPMLQTAIEYRDPSFNRIFLRPCLQVFGDTKVTHWLNHKFKDASLKERI